MLVPSALLQHHQTATVSRKLPRSEGSHQPLTPKPATGDESSSMKDELKKSYKRIADLETRVHDLTLQSSLVSVCGRVWGVGCVCAHRCEREFRLMNINHICINDC